MQLDYKFEINKFQINYNNQNQIFKTFNLCPRFEFENLQFEIYLLFVILNLKFLTTIRQLFVS